MTRSTNPLAGGSYIRQPDGSLTREEGALANPAFALPASPTPESATEPEPQPASKAVPKPAKLSRRKTDSEE